MPVLNRFFSLFAALAVCMLAACDGQSRLTRTSGPPSDPQVAQLSDPGGQAVTLSTNVGEFQRARRVSNPDPANTPAGVNFDAGFYDFTISGLTPGQTVEVTLELGENRTPTSYYKYHDGQFLNFAFNGNEGAQFNGSSVTLTITDGGLGDDDGSANGVIVDPGAPGFAFVADTSPEAFAFTDITNQPTSTVVTSDTVTIAGINTAADISVTDGEYSIGCDATGFTATPGTIDNGQAVCVRHTTAAASDATVTTTLTVGDTSGTFSSTTSPVTAATFDITGTISGVPGSNSVGQWELRIGGTFANDGGLINGAVTYNANGVADGASYTVTALPNSGFSCVVSNGSGTVSGGDVTGVDIACQAADTTPDAFVFTDQTEVPQATVTTSDAVTISGIDAPASISVSGGEYSIGCTASFTNSADTINNGDSVCVRHTSANAPATATDTTLTVGGVSDTYTSTTVAAQAAFSVSGNISVTPSTSSAGTWELRVDGGFNNDGGLDDGTVTYGTGIADGSTYEVLAVAATGFECTVTNGSGTINGADISNVDIGCTASGGGGDPTESVAINGWRWANPLPQGDNMQAVLQLGGTTYALGQNVMTRSSTGSWVHLGRIDSNLNFSEFEQAPNVLVAYNTNNADRGIFSSADALNWTKATSDRVLTPFGRSGAELLALSLRSVNGTLDEFLIRSTDGSTWTASAVTLGDGTVIDSGQPAGNGDGNLVVGLNAYSTDNGASWHVSSVVENGNPVAAADARIVWDGAQFVGIAGRDSYTSANGAIWDKHANADQDPITQRGFNGTLSTNGNGLLVSAKNISATVLVSNDGINFSEVEMPALPSGLQSPVRITHFLTSNFLADGTLVTATESGVMFSSADNAQTFARETSGLTTSSSSNTVAVRAFASNGQFAVAGGIGGLEIIGSTAIDTWEEQALPTFRDRFNREFPALDRYVGAHWSGSRFIVQGNQQYILSSTDGQTWEIIDDRNFGSSGTRDPDRVTFAQSGDTIVNTKFVRSTDAGVSFDAAISRPSGSYTTVRHDGSNFVAVGQQAAISADGETWTTHDLSFDADAQNFGIDRIESFDVMGGNYIGTWFGQVLTSPDAINWSLADPVDDQFADIGGEALNDPDCVVDVVSGAFYLACDGGLLFSSADGSNWTQLMGNSATIDFNAGTIANDGSLVVTTQDLKGVSQHAGNLVVYGEGYSILYRPLD